MVGLPSCPGTESIWDEGALSPTFGGCAVARLAGDSQDRSSDLQDMVMLIDRNRQCKDSTLARSCIRCIESSSSATLKVLHVRYTAQASHLADYSRLARADAASCVMSGAFYRRYCAGTRSTPLTVRVAGCPNASSTIRVQRVCHGVRRSRANGRKHARHVWASRQ